MAAEPNERKKTKESSPLYLRAVFSFQEPFFAQLIEEIFERARRTFQEYWYKNIRRTKTAFVSNREKFFNFDSLTTPIWTAAIIIFKPKLLFLVCCKSRKFSITFIIFSSRLSVPLILILYNIWDRLSYLKAPLIYHTNNSSFVFLQLFL